MSIAAGRVSALFALVMRWLRDRPWRSRRRRLPRRSPKCVPTCRAAPTTRPIRSQALTATMCANILATLKSIDRDEWAAAWSAMGERHAKEATAASDTVQKREHWRQAWLDYHFGAWPAQNTDGKRAAYKKAVEAFRAYAALLDPPAETVRIPFEGKEIVGYLRLPAGAGAKPVVISIGGLDEYKEFGVEHVSGPLVSAGLGSLSLDMPGTGEAPVKMEVGAERMISKAIDYLISRPEVDARRIAVNGASAGGYWSALAAYSERTRIRAAVAQGAPIHEYFRADWQRKSWGTSEYLFELERKRECLSMASRTTRRRSSLPSSPPLAQDARRSNKDPSAPMLVVNGEQDTQVPIADLYLLLKTGTPKFAWVNPEGGHTGRSKEWPQDKITGEVVAPWLATMTAVAPASH